MTFPAAAARRDPFAIVTEQHAQPRRMFGLLATPPAERRVFADAGLQASIDRIANSLPSDARAFEAEIGYREGQGVAGVIVYKTAGGWVLIGGAFYNQGEYGATIGARKVWK